MQMALGLCSGKQAQFTIYVGREIFSQELAVVVIVGQDYIAGHIKQLQVQLIPEKPLTES